MFVADDSEIVRMGRELKAAPGIVVKSPSECLAFLHELFGRAKKVPQWTIVPSFRNREQQDRVSFDHINNNGFFDNGEGGTH